MNNFVYTDNNPLTYVLSSAKLNATGLRWIVELADFNFTIRYRAGKTNTDADNLSSMPELMGEYMASCTEETCQHELCAIIQSAKEQDQGRELTGFLPSHTTQAYRVKVNPNPQRKMNQGLTSPIFDKLNSVIGKHH